MGPPPPDTEMPGALANVLVTATRVHHVGPLPHAPVRGLAEHGTEHARECLWPQCQSCQLLPLSQQHSRGFPTRSKGSEAGSCLPKGPKEQHTTDERGWGMAGSCDSEPGEPKTLPKIFLSAEGVPQVHYSWL